VIDVRPAGPADAPGISDLAAEVQTIHAAAQPTIFKPAGPDTFPPAAIRELMATPGHRFWVATSGDAANEMLGYVYATVHAQPETTWRYATTVVTLDQMSVAARHRRHGVGGRLVTAVRDAAAALGAAEVRLNVWAFNESARAFYDRCGFIEVQQRLYLPVLDDTVPSSAKQT